MLARVLVLAALASTVPNATVVRQATRAPGGWAVIAPAQGSGWQCANRSDQEWAVADAADGVRVSPYQASGDARLVLPDGELRGVNQGEFGGSLVWVGKDSRRVTVSTQVNPVALIRRGDDVFVASGLAHLGLASGAVLRLRRSNRGAWQVEKVMDLGEAPYAGVRVDDRTWVIVTSGGVTRIDLSTLAQKRIYQNRNWAMIYPNSIRPLDKAWLIGARRAVLRLAPAGQGYSESWLVPASCKQQLGPGCACQP
ncbi:MAG: hypothetical protein NT117_03205 [Gammaproteobacteria bacterium]|nr:hypothetical protein [Gammaproteobacteria bacterium]